MAHITAGHLSASIKCGLTAGLCETSWTYVFAWRKRWNATGGRKIGICGGSNNTRYEWPAEPVMQATTYRPIYVHTIETNSTLNALMLGLLTLAQSTVPFKEILLYYHVCTQFKTIIGLTKLEVQLVTWFVCACFVPVVDLHTAVCLHPLYNITVSLSQHTLPTISITT